jgi:hypothetical protein
MTNQHNQHCPDGGVCHHWCKDACIRVLCCGPLSDVFPGDKWPTDISFAPSKSIPALGVRAPDAPVTYLVPFIVGDGRDPILLTVTYWAEFLRDVAGLCAFCHGDPCAEYSGHDTLIGNYFARNSAWAETCPCCDGRPS